MMARRQHGPLTVEEISKGLEACIDNASALVLDAEVLMQAGRPTRALTCLLVTGQELGKILYLQAMLTIGPNDADRWKQIWKAFYNHSSKASGGLLALLDPNTSVSEVGQSAYLNSMLGGTAEQERNRTLYVDFDDRDRSWSAPIGNGSNMAGPLLHLTQQALAPLLSNRQVGLHSPIALEIIREVFTSNPILDVPDSKAPADPVILAKLLQESLDRNEIIGQRLRERGFDIA